jgi:hypothetical protein
MFEESELEVPLSEFVSILGWAPTLTFCIQPIRKNLIHELLPLRFHANTVVQPTGNATKQIDT